MEEDQIGPVCDGGRSERVPVRSEVVRLVSDDGEPPAEEVAGEETDGEMDLAVTKDLCACRNGKEGACE